MSLMSKVAEHRKAFAVASSVITGLAFASTVFAQTPPTPPPDPFQLDKAKPAKLGNENLIVTVGRIIDVALGLLGVIALVIVLAGGFKWMTAGGNEEKTGEARKLIFSGIIGLAIILSAFAISKFVLDNLASATKSG